MKLCYAPGSASLAARIVLIESGLECELHQSEALIDATTGPWGLTLELDDGRRVLESAGVLQALADRHPDAGLMPTRGLYRVRVQEWLALIAEELHRPVMGLANPAIVAGDKAILHEQLSRRFDWISVQLWERSWAATDYFSVADAYLFSVLRESAESGASPADWPVLCDYQYRVQGRPSVMAALRTVSCAAGTALSGIRPQLEPVQRFEQ